MPSGFFFHFCCRLLTFFQILPFQKNSGPLSECQTVLDPDQDRRSVGPYLDANFLQRLSADDTSRQRVNDKNKSRNKKFKVNEGISDFD